MVAAQVRKPGRRTPFGTSRGPTDTDGMRIHPQDSRLRGNGRVFKGELSFFTAKARAGAPGWGKRRPPLRPAAARKLRRISTSAPARARRWTRCRHRAPSLTRTPPRPNAFPHPGTVAPECLPSPGHLRSHGTSARRAPPLAPAPSLARMPPLASPRRDGALDSTRYEWAGACAIAAHRACAN